MTHGFLSADIGQVGAVVRGVHRRWRLSRALRGVALTLAAVLAALVAWSLVLETMKYPPSLVIAARISIVLLAAVLTAWFIVRPQLPRVRDEQVALFVEEHEPSFEGALLAAVELEGLEPRAESREPGTISPEIAARVRAAAVGRASAIHGGRDIDARGLRLSFGALVGAAAMTLAVLTMGPQGLRYGMGALLSPFASAEEVNPFRIDVEPGDATIARGASIVISAQPVGFQAEGVELWARTSDSASWNRIPMSADSTGRFAARLLDVSAPMEYLIESTGLRSRAYRLSVADLPYAKRIDLDYRFPAYTGLPAQHVDSTGDIVGPPGTTVRVKITPTVPTNGGRLVVEGGDTLALVRAADGTLSASLRLSRSGYYRVELAGARGDLLTASLNYSIDVLPDRPPSVRFTKPGRDTKVLAVDEVFTEARAEDDYGVAKLELVYQVNGGEEKSVPLHQATSRIIRDIAAGHTFMLEDYELVPGDVVSYYARATDNDAVRGGKSATSDIYFLEVRPYSTEYRQDQGGGGGGGGGGGQQGDSPQQLSRRQREIIAGTFNTLRDTTGDRKTREEDIATLRLAQQKLKEDVSELAAQLEARGVTKMDTGLAKIAKILPAASATMDSAEKILGEGKLRDALGPEQRALQLLQRAEAEYRTVRISMGQQGGGGGGGGNSPSAEDLADLFELQQERMRNQYETVQREQRGDEQAQQSAEVDAAAERLRQLAARQQQQNERAQRKADSLSRSMGASGSSGGEAQRQLAQDVEQAARQLERLARERQSQSLAEAARRLDEASDAMRRSAAQGQQGSASSQQAMDRLRDARRLLDEERTNRTQRAADDAVSAGRRLAEQQQRVSEDVARSAQATGAQREEIQRSLERRKGEMADSARALGRLLDRAATEARREAPAVSREMNEAADTLRARRIEDKIRTTQEWVRQTPPESQSRNERVIAADIESLNRSLEDIQGAARAGRQADTTRRNAEALDRARDLVRGVESLNERAQQQAERRLAEQGQRGQAGQESQQGQSGQTPSSAQGQGQQGQRGQGQAQGQAQGQGGGGGNPEGNDAGPGGNQSREMRQRLNDARALRRELSGRGVDLSQLDRAIQRMEGLSNGRGGGGDPRAEAELREQVINGLRSFEFSLGRAFGQQPTERALVDRAGEVPPEYRKSVEEYYRALGRAKP